MIWLMFLSIVQFYFILSLSKWKMETMKIVEEEEGENNDSKLKFNATLCLCAWERSKSVYLIINFS